MTAATKQRLLALLVAAVTILVLGLGLLSPGPRGKMWRFHGQGGQR